MKSSLKGGVKLTSFSSSVYEYSLRGVCEAYDVSFRGEDLYSRILEINKQRSRDDKFVFIKSLIGKGFVDKGGGIHKAVVRVIDKGRILRDKPLILGS